MPDTSPNLTQTEAFIKWWFSCVPSGSYFEIRQRNKDGVRKHFFTSAAHAIDFCARNSTFAGDWWFGLQPRMRQGGTKDDVAQHVFYGLDFDHKAKTENGTPP